MLNFCLFAFIIYAMGHIIDMITRPAEFFTVFKRTDGRTRVYRKR